MEPSGLKPQGNTVAQPANGKPNTQVAEAISSLLGSGDAWVKLLTLALVILGGAGNWFATARVGDDNRQDWKEARAEISQFFRNQQTYLTGLQGLAQNSEDTKWIRLMLQQQADSTKASVTVLRSNNEELTQLKDELEKLKAELKKPVDQRSFQ
jgi:hypothetical protein